MIATTDSLHRIASLRGDARETGGADAAREFEALLVSQLLQSASEPLFEDSLLDGGSAGRMARDQFFTHLASEAVKGRGFGLAEQMREQESETAEESQGEQP